MTPHSLEKRSAPLSRRDFIKSLIPGWATKENLLAAAAGAGLLMVLAVALSFFRDIGFLNTLKFAALGLGLYGALRLIAWFMRLSQRALQKSPPLVQSLAVVFVRFVTGIALCVLGAFAYNHWQSTKDKTDIVVGLSAALIAAFSDEWQKRRASQQLTETRESS